MEKCRRRPYDSHVLGSPGICEFTVISKGNCGFPSQAAKSPADKREERFRDTFHSSGDQAALQGTLFLGEQGHRCRTTGGAAFVALRKLWAKAVLTSHESTLRSRGATLAVDGPTWGSQGCMMEGCAWRDMPVTLESNPYCVFRSTLQKGPGKGATWECSLWEGHVDSPAKFSLKKTRGAQRGGLRPISKARRTEC